MNGANISTAANDKVEGCDGCCASCSQSCGSKKEDKEANV
jgi:hypothetical protein